MTTKGAEVSPPKKAVSPPTVKRLPEDAGRTLWQRILSTKLLLTVGSLVMVFWLAYKDKDVSKLDVLVPMILLFYNGPNVFQDVMNRRTEQLVGQKRVKKSRWAETETIDSED